MDEHETDKTDSGLAVDSVSAGSRWRDVDWPECGECGSHDCETLTDAENPYQFDGDTIRCKSCGELGQVMCDSEMPVTAFWNGADGLEVSIIENVKETQN